MITLYGQVTDRERYPGVFFKLKEGSDVSDLDAYQGVGMGQDTYLIRSVKHFAWAMGGTFENGEYSSWHGHHVKIHVSEDKWSRFVSFLKDTKYNPVDRVITYPPECFIPFKEEDRVILQERYPLFSDRPYSDPKRNKKGWDPERDWDLIGLFKP